MKHATDTQFAELRAMAAEYERLTGTQGYLYASQPETTEIFHFGDGTTQRGIEAALLRQRGDLVAAQGRSLTDGAQGAVADAPATDDVEAGVETSIEADAQAKRP